MTVYYIRHEDYDSRAKVIHGLVEIYQLGSYRLTAVDVPENLQGVIGPLLESLAEHIERPYEELPGDPPVDTSMWMVEPQAGDLRTSTVSNPPAQEITPTPFDYLRAMGYAADTVSDPEPTRLVEVKKPRKAMKQELCPECGRMGVMTKKGYCKLCAMRKAREAKNPPPSVPP